MSNVFSFTGACGADAEIRYIPSGQAVLSVNVANNVGFGDKQKTMWIRVTLWGKRAESNLKDYLKKGQQVFVSGELTTNEYTANDGTKRTQLELNASILDLVGRKNDNPQSQPTPTPASAYTPPHEQHRRDVANHNQQQQGAPQYDAPYDDDIPF
jgi:single-strand DNA-binding protein